MILRKSGLWDSVHLDAAIDRSFVLSLVCKHKDMTTYTRTDYRSGAGWMSDAYAGTVCIDCGEIINEKQVY